VVVRRGASWNGIGYETGTVILLGTSMVRPKEREEVARERDFLVRV
jgi:hypothetical protein